MNMYKTFGTLFTIACLFFSANNPVRNSAKDTKFAYDSTIACYTGDSLSERLEVHEQATDESTTNMPDKNKIKVSIQVGSTTFTATLSDNASSKAFAERLPMTLNMSELNGNEKYYFMSSGLPTNAERVGNINSGDIMLYGSDCLVLFYEDFQTSYSYTRLGHIEDVSGLADALGTGPVQIIWSLSK